MLRLADRPRAGGTHSIFSVESTDGTNSLLMNNPVGTVIVLPEAATVSVTGWAMVCSCRRLLRTKVEVDERERSTGGMTCPRSGADDRILGDKRLVHGKRR